LKKSITHQTKEVVEYSDEATKTLLNIVKTVKESTAEALKKNRSHNWKKLKIDDMTENKQALNNDNASKNSEMN
jgi:hypothetical protein